MVKLVISIQAVTTSFYLQHDLDDMDNITAASAYDGIPLAEWISFDLDE